MNNRVNLNTDNVIVGWETFVNFGIHFCWIHQRYEGTQEMVMVSEDEAGQLAEAILRRWPDVREEVLRQFGGQE